MATFLPCRFFKNFKNHSESTMLLLLSQPLKMRNTSPWMSPLGDRRLTEHSSHRLENDAKVLSEGLPSGKSIPESKNSTLNCKNFFAGLRQNMLV